MTCRRRSSSGWFTERKSNAKNELGNQALRPLRLFRRVRVRIVVEFHLAALRAEVVRLAAMFGLHHGSLALKACSAYRIDHRSGSRLRCTQGEMGNRRM